METAVIFVNRGIVVFGAAADHDVRTGSKFNGPALGPSLPRLVVDVIVHKHIFIVRAWGKCNLKLNSHTGQIFHRSVGVSIGFIFGAVSYLDIGGVSLPAIGGLDPVLGISRLPGLQAAQVETVGVDAGRLLTGPGSRANPRVSRTLAGSTSQILIGKLRGSICNHRQLRRSQAHGQANCQNQGNKTFP